ncbi:MAG: segregation/condensation protein A [Candidatus Marinimicrobia bacterium]|nr:segregation/condensation protein A [Candidatus Neomarinimicrobiota bacterium]
MSYQIHLDVFEGPVDLLLYFIKRDEINIYDIPIMKITRDYLEYLDVMKTLDLKLAGDFVSMAALLMRIKAQMLIPRVQEAIENEEIEDPRNELVRRLLEYQYFKEIGGELKKLEEENAGKFPRNPNWSYIDHELLPEDALSHVSLFDILNAYKQAMDRLPADAGPHEVAADNTSITEQVHFIYSHFKRYPRLRFSVLTRSIRTKLVLVVTVVAILELMRSQKIRVTQSDSFSDFIIEPKANGA